MTATSLTEAEAAHARSILEPAVVRPIPPKRTLRVLVAVPVRKPLSVLRQLWRTLCWQRLRTPVVLDALFAPNFAPGEGAEELAWLAGLSAEGTVAGVMGFGNDPAPAAADYADGSETRRWMPSAFTRLAILKNRLLQHALDGGYDFVWLLDADVMCDPWTLQSLLDSADIERWLTLEGAIAPPIVAGVYWTRWQRPQPGTRHAVHAGPQVWLTHPYGLSGRGWTEPDFRQALVDRKRLQVWGLGACTLVPIGAILKGVHFGRFDGLPVHGGMAEGEDRHFCAHATSRHVTLIADAWPDIYHAYHPADYGQLPQEVDALERPVAAPAIDDLVSAKIELLEPVPDQLGRVLRLGPRWVRGKLGTLPVLPQIAETLAGLACGHSRLIKLHYPSHYPEPQLRLASVVARITLFDRKPFRMPPVIGEEFIVGGGSLRAIDTTTHTRVQLDALLTPTES